LLAFGNKYMNHDSAAALSGLQDDAVQYKALEYSLNSLKKKVTLDELRA
jgi:hypothetical protein